MNPDLKKLPEKIRDLILSDELMDITEKTAVAHNLRPEYYGALFRITVKILKGILETKDFVGQLVYELDTDRETAIAIAQEINRDVFTGVKEELMQLHGLTPIPTPPAPTVSAPGIPQKTGPSSYATPETVAGVVAPQTMPSMPMAPAPKMDSFVAPSPLQSTLNVAAMKATPVLPPAPMMTAPQTPHAPQAPQSVPQAMPQESMRTITMDQPRAPIITPPSAPASVTTPVQNMPIPEQPPMNIFEEKLGTAFRMKSEPLVSTPNYTSPQVPSTEQNIQTKAVPPVAPAKPIIQPTLQSASASQTPPRTSPHSMIGVVPAAAAPLPVTPTLQVAAPWPTIAQVTPPSVAPIASSSPVIQTTAQPTQPTNASVTPMPTVGSDPYREPA